VELVKKALALCCFLALAKNCYIPTNCRYGCYCTGACEEEAIDINALIVNQEAEEELGYILPGELKPHERKDNSNEKI